MVRSVHPQRKKTCGPCWKEFSRADKQCQQQNSKHSKGQKHMPRTLCPRRNIQGRNGLLRAINLADCTETLTKQTQMQRKRLTQVPSTKRHANETPDASYLMPAALSAETAGRGVASLTRHQLRSPMSAFAGTTAGSGAASLTRHQRRLAPGRFCFR